VDTYTCSIFPATARSKSGNPVSLRLRDLNFFYGRKMPIFEINRVLERVRICVERGVEKPWLTSVVYYVVGVTIRVVVAQDAIDSLYFLPFLLNFFAVKCFGNFIAKTEFTVCPTGKNSCLTTNKSLKKVTSMSLC
jgi:hypothetical protein